MRSIPTIARWRTSESRRRDERPAPAEVDRPFRRAVGAGLPQSDPDRPARRASVVAVVARQALGRWRRRARQGAGRQGLGRPVARPGLPALPGRRTRSRALAAFGAPASGSSAATAYVESTSTRPTKNWPERSPPKSKRRSAVCRRGSAAIPRRSILYAWRANSLTGCSNSGQQARSASASRSWLTASSSSPMACIPARTRRIAGRGRWSPSRICRSSKRTC